MNNTTKSQQDSLQECMVQEGEQSPYADLTVDLAFKKAFDPDKPASRENLVNLLNDILGPQLKRPIREVHTRNVAQNLSGSAKSRTAIFDLHCADDQGNLIEIEVQIQHMPNFVKRLGYDAGVMVANQAETGTGWRFSAKPTYVIAITHDTLFQDDRAVHRGTVADLETGEQLMDLYNFTILELPKVPLFIEKSSDSVAKWLFFFRYLNRLKKLPDALDESKFSRLTESSRVSNFTRKEFEAYQHMYHEEWDRNALRAGFIEDNPDFIEEIRCEGASAKAREMAKSLKASGVSLDVIAKSSGLSEDEIRAL